MIELNISIWYFLITLIISVTLFMLLMLKIRTISNLEKEISLQKKIIANKTKNHVSGDNKRIYNKGLILSFTASGIITSVNKAFSEFLGFDDQDLLGKHVIGDLIPEKDSKGNNMTHLVDLFVENPKLYVDIETEVLTKRKEKRWISWTNKAIYNENGQAISFTGVGYDITARKKLEKELEEVSSADIITGVYNKATFIDVGNKELMRATRYNRDLSVLVLIVHRNLNYEGEKNNDFFLQQAVDVCNALIRDCDYIGRIGDNEFAMLLPETQITNAHTLIKRIKNKVESITQEENSSFAIESIGASGRQAGDESIDKLIIRSFKSFDQFKESQII